MAEKALRDDFLADAPFDDIASREKISPKGRLVAGIMRQFLDGSSSSTSTRGC